MRGRTVAVVGGAPLVPPEGRADVEQQRRVAARGANDVRAGLGAPRDARHGAAQPHHLRPRTRRLRRIGGRCEKPLEPRTEGLAPHAAAPAPHLDAAPRVHLPHPDRAVVRPRREPLPQAVHRHGPHLREPKRGAQDRERRGNKPAIRHASLREPAPRQRESRERALFVCPVKAMSSAVGNGCSSLGLGSCGRRLFGSTLRRCFTARGHR